MKVKLTKDEIIILIKQYYKEALNKDVDVEITASKDYTGIYESRVCKTKITIKEKINILGKEIVAEYVINDDDIYRIFNDLLKDSNYIIDSLNYNAGIRSTGFYDYEEAYFDGVTLTLINKNKMMIRERIEK